MIAHFIRSLCRFGRDTRGTLSVEAALMLPMLCFFYVGSFVWFDAFRAQNTNLKAAYTLADMISREDNVSDAYLNGLNTVFDYLTFSRHPTYVRATSITCRSDCENEAARDLDICWSWASAGRPALTAETFVQFEDKIPLMPLGDTVMFTETFMAYEPPFNVGIGPQRFENFVVTRPRFSPSVAWTSGTTVHDCL